MRQEKPQTFLKQQQLPSLGKSPQQCPRKQLKFHAWGHARKRRTQCVSTPKPPEWCWQKGTSLQRRRLTNVLTKYGLCSTRLGPCHYWIPWYSKEENRPYQYTNPILPIGDCAWLRSRTKAFCIDEQTTSWKYESVKTIIEQIVFSYISSSNLETFQPVLRSTK